MRRADRLFRLVQTLRGGRLWTAARLAEAMEVSERTIYRDVADLQASGVPIDGAAGVGYLMRSGYDLPPLMFEREEIDALVLGARLVAAWGGARMASGARDALSKIEAVLPRAELARDALARLDAPPVGLRDEDRERIDRLDAASRERRVATLLYARADGARSTRRVRPLGLWFWGAKWTLVAWCELRDDFRMFRLDRIEALEVGEERFEPSPERSLPAFLARTVEQEGCELPPDPFV